VKKPRKSARPTMSPLLRALAHSRATREPMIELMLLKCYTAVDAFSRGHGSQALFITLCRHMLIAEELCRLGHGPDHVDDITCAHKALVEIEAHHASNGQWTLDEATHPRLCDALVIFGAQLEAASLEQIARAEASMVTQSLVAARAGRDVRSLEFASSDI